jgi:Bacterial SH3 domain
MNSRESGPARTLTLLVAAVAGALPLLIAINTTARGEALKPLATNRETNLRKAPRSDSEIVTVIPKGMPVMVGNCHAGWCRVSWNGQDGYAIGRILGIAPPLHWPTDPIVTWPGDDGSSQKTVKAAREHEEGGAEHSFVLEIGTAGEWPLNAEHRNFGGTIGAEIEPIENWLEVEFGLSTLTTTGHTELSGDLLFKKPFRLSPTVEFMIGAGPSFSRTLNGPEQGDSWSTEFALDWMFWPTKNVGWFIEPTWSVNPRSGQQSAAVSVGVLIGFPK